MDYSIAPITGDSAIDIISDGFVLYKFNSYGAFIGASGFSKTVLYLTNDRINSASYIVKDSGIKVYLCRGNSSSPTIAEQGIYSNVFHDDIADADIVKVEGYFSNLINDVSDIGLTVFASEPLARTAILDGIWDYAPTIYPITYRLTNATSTGPNEAAIGDTVTVPLTFPEGYGVVNPSSDVYVTCNGVLVPSTYSDGQLVFTMPDPS